MFGGLGMAELVVVVLFVLLLLGMLRPPPRNPPPSAAAVVTPRGDGPKRSAHADDPLVLPKADSTAGSSGFEVR